MAGYLLRISSDAACLHHHSRSQVIQALRHPLMEVTDTEETVMATNNTEDEMGVMAADMEDIAEETDTRALLCHINL